MFHATADDICTLFSACPVNCVVLMCLQETCHVVVVVRSSCLEKAVKVLLSAVNVVNSCDVTVRLLPWLIATSQHDLSLMRMIVESETIRCQPLFRCIDEGTLLSVTVCLLVSIP